jgi:hypothetical protein
MIESGVAPTPAASVFAYNANFRNGCAYIGVVAASPAVSTVAPMAGLGLFISYLFANWPLRRLYATAREYSFERYASGARRVFTIVGRLEDDCYVQGRYWDTLLLQVE